MGLEQVFHNLTVKQMDSLRKQIQSPVDYVLNECFEQNLQKCYCLRERISL